MSDGLAVIESLSYVRLREMKIKMITHHCTPIRNKKKRVTPNAGVDVEQQKFHHCWWKVVHPLWKTIWWFFSILKILLPYNPAVVLFIIYSPKGVEHICPHKNLYTDVLEALFIMAKTWKQPSYPSGGECINSGTSDSGIIIFHSVLKRNERSRHEKTGRKLKSL